MTPPEEASAQRHWPGPACSKLGGIGTAGLDLLTLGTSLAQA